MTTGGLLENCQKTKPAEKITLFFLTCIVLFSSCAADIYFKKNLTFRKLGVKLSYKDTRYPELGEAYQKELDVFISTFNAENRAFQLYRTDSLTATSIHLQIDHTRLVPVIQQVGTMPLTILAYASVATIMTAPLTTPLNKSKGVLEFSPEMCEPKHIRKGLLFTSSGYFGSKKALLRRHNRKIPQQYADFFYGLEKIYKQHVKFYHLDALSGR